MSLFAFLAPVGPFAGLSNAARQRISERFPALSIADIESAAASFLTELQTPKIEPRLAEARQELNIFAKELARFHGALNQVRRHRLDDVIGEISRDVSGENGLEGLDRCLNNVRTAIQQTTRTLPLGRPEFASRRLVATLARHMSEAGLAISSTESEPLASLVDLILDDLMVGGDAACAVREWQQGKASPIDQERASILLDLVP